MSEAAENYKTETEETDMQKGSTELAEYQSREAVQHDSTSSLVLDTGSMDKMMAMAEIMAKGVATVPKHLQGSPSDCLAVIMQAMQWQMNPYAVAQKTHLVNGTLGYEAQLVNAVLQNSRVVRGRPHYEYKGEGQSLECRVGFIPAGESTVVWNQWLKSSDVTTKNSPVWKTNPKQQLGYLQVKNWARAFCPGAILGVYTPDEIESFEHMERDITPQPQTKEDLDEYPAADFTKNLPAWTRAIEDGKITADDIAKKVETKGRLTKKQLEALKKVKKTLANNQESAG